MSVCDSHSSVPNTSFILDSVTVTFGDTPKAEVNVADTKTVAVTAADTDTATRVIVAVTVTDTISITNTISIPAIVADTDAVTQPQFGCHINVIKFVR